MKKFMIIAGVLLISSAALADKESAKGRLDDCFLQLMQISQQVNNTVGTDDQPYFNHQFDVVQARCLALKSDYVKQYGKYSLPRVGGL